MSLDRSTRRDLVALGGLAGLVVTGLALVVGSASAEHSFTVPGQAHGVPGWVGGPLAPYGTGMTASRFALLLAAMWVFYLVVLTFADAIRARWALGAIAILVVAFSLAPPLLTRDVFNYIDYARLGALHHLNPYSHGPIAAPGDPIFQFARWRHTPSVYGPLFTAASYLIAPLGLAGALWSLKALTGAACLACVALVWRCAQRAGTSPVFAAALLGLNPVLLVYAVGGAHNDVFGLVFVVAAIALMLANREALGGAALVGALAVKATAGIAMPFVALGAKRHRTMLCGIALATALVGLFGYVLFGIAVLEPFKLAIQHQDYYSGQSVPPHVAVLVGANPQSSTVRAVAEFVSLAAVAGLLVWTAFRRDWVSGAGWATVAVLAGTTFLLAWYTIWALPWAAVGRSRALLYGTLGVGTFVVASHLYLVGH